MNSVIKMIYERWQEDSWDREDPEGIQEANKEFRQTLKNITNSGDIWDAMTICQTAAAKEAFTAGLKLGYRLHEELEGIA